MDGSVIPGMVGLEAGQSSFGDVYAMFRRVLEFPVRNILPETLAGKLTEEEIQAAVDQTCDRIIAKLTVEAEKIPVEESTMIATDWINGRRTPDANQLLQGAISGINLGTTAPMIFRALVEATAFGSRAIVERFKSEGMRINDVIGIGGIALKSPFVMQTLSNVLNMPIKVCNTDQACALGAAMFAATAAGAYATVADAQDAMNSGFAKEYFPEPDQVKIYDEVYQRYLKLGAYCEEVAK